ncbi:MAG: HupE/UreJ family protein [Hyphomicrobiaceae bacterium]
MRTRKFHGLTAAIMLLAPTAAFAHHPMGGTTPSNFTEGLLSGLGHPIIGVDHLAAIIGVGLMAALLGRPRILPIAFIAAMLAGVGLHLGEFNLPFAEGLVGLVTLVIGGLVAARFSLGTIATAALFAVAGAVHGYALGESIVGAEQTALSAYLLGLGIIQAVIAIGIAELASRYKTNRETLSRYATTAAGVVIAIVGLATVANASGLLG